MNHHAGSISILRIASLADVGRGVMVVVQPLAGGEEREPLQVPRRVLERLATEGVAHCIHSATEREVRHRVEERGHDAPDRAEHDAQEHDADAQSEERVVEQDAVPPIGGQIARVPRHLLGIVRHLAVERHVRELHADPTEQCGGVGIALDVGEGVVLAMDGDPLAGPDATLIQITRRKNQARPGRIVIARWARVRWR